MAWFGSHAKARKIVCQQHVSRISRHTLTRCGPGRPVAECCTPGQARRTRARHRHVLAVAGLYSGASQQTTAVPMWSYALGPGGGPGPIIWHGPTFALRRPRSQVRQHGVGSRRGASSLSEAWAIAAAVVGRTALSQPAQTAAAAKALVPVDRLPRSWGRPMRAAAGDMTVVPIPWWVWTALVAFTILGQAEHVLFKTGRYRAMAHWYFDQRQPFYVRNLPFAALPFGLMFACWVLVVIVSRFQGQLWADLIGLLIFLVSLGARGRDRPRSLSEGRRKPTGVDRDARMRRLVQGVQIPVAARHERTYRCTDPAPVRWAWPPARPATAPTPGRSPPGVNLS
jgi:hypothetical protein